MIKALKIERFKSIKELQIDCRRVNLFIGEPNVGKSNILEALGLWSWCGKLSVKLKEYVRFQSMTDLFYDGLSSDGPISIEVEGEPQGRVMVSYEQARYMFRTATIENPFVHLDGQGERNSAVMNPQGACGGVRFYRFKELESFDNQDSQGLAQPTGDNLFSVVFGSKRLRERVSDIFRVGGMSLVMKPQEKTFELQKTIDGVVTAYPYPLTSDTLRRVAFYAVAMESNKNSTLVFEEPEAHSFPFYTKQMGEEIALDESNQYFIATHNPYLLTAVVEKAKKEDVQVFVTYFKDFETKVTPLSNEQLEIMLDGDPFYMSQRFVGGAGE